MPSDRGGDGVDNLSISQRSDDPDSTVMKVDPGDILSQSEALPRISNMRKMFEKDSKPPPGPSPPRNKTIQRTTVEESTTFSSVQQESPSSMTLEQRPRTGSKTHLVITEIIETSDTGDEEEEEEDPSSIRVSNMVA